MLLPSRFVIFILIIPIAIFLFLGWEKEQDWAGCAIPFIVLAAAAFSMSPQIDWWWYKRNPPGLDVPVKKLLLAMFPFYRKQTEEKKSVFCQRTALTMMATEYIVPSGDDEKKIPEDLKALIAAHAVMMTWDRENYIMDSFEKVVVYAKPFPSPIHPAHLHASESNAEDGVALFSTERMLQSLMEPDKVFNALAYEYSLIFRIHYKTDDFALPENVWEVIEQIGGIDKMTIEEHLGLPEPDASAVLMSYARLFEKEFGSYEPELFETVVNRLK